ncbi:MAG: complex I NDUFA9 subunit family protein [Geobacter sp.]|nr:MAG: complex I NDUFA9 subunit family protein [Geobacter sp.]
MRIFLAGGTGFVGGHVRCALLENGHELRVLSHRRLACTEPGIEAVEGDVTRPETLAAAMQECDAVINLVGIIREFPARGVTFEKLHVEATNNLLAAARHAGIRRFIQMSALGARPDAVSRYHQTKYQAEEAVRASGLDWTIFRPSVIFGPKDNFINKLADLVKKLPLVPVIGDGCYRLQPIDGNDVARCFAMALEMPETVGQSYGLCGRDRITYRELLTIVARTLGKRSVRTLQVPVSFMTLVTPLLQRFSFFPITMDQITMLLEESICDGAWKETFRFDPVSIEEAIHVYLQ